MSQPPNPPTEQERAALNERERWRKIFGSPEGMASPEAVKIALGMGLSVGETRRFISLNVPDRTH